MIAKLISLLAYKSVWLFGVYGSLHFIDFISPILAFFYVIWFLIFYSFKLNHFKYLLIVSFVGILVESFIFNQFVYQLNLPNPLAPLVPIWLIAIWFAFPCMCRMSLSKPLKSFSFSLIFGLLICPLPYLAAAKFGTTSFINQTEGLLILSISWAFIMITIHYLLKSLR